MLELNTGKPGASKTLNTLASIIKNNCGTRPIYYTNIRLLMLDYRVCDSFSGWFYGAYLLKLKNKAALKRLNKIIKRVHDEDRFVELSDVPWLESYYEASSPLDTWLYWVRRLYSKKQLHKIEEFLSNMPAEKLNFSHLVQFNLHFIKFDNARDWYSLPKRSHILIDECQQFFPPRAVGSAVPAHISKFETHRHDGFDIYLITQDRMLLDSNVRRLVNKHIHFHNPFNSNRVTRYQHSKSFDADNFHDLKACQKSLIKRDSNLYGAYFSSDFHSHKFQMPKVFYILIGLILFVGYSVYSFANVFLDKSVSETPAVTEVKSDIKVISEPTKVSLSLTHSTLLSDDEKKYLSEFVTKTVDGVFINGSQYVKSSNGLVHYDYSFYNPSTNEIFSPTSVGFKVSPINECLARLTFNDFTTFVTCQPLIKLEEKRKDDFSLAKT